jgi:CheY-like chemotaxis protein
MEINIKMSGTPKQTILIIEDEPDVTTYLSTILDDNGYKVETASDGVEAMRKIRTLRPDLISLDISLPTKTGVNIYCELKEDPQLSSIPVVMVTGIQQDFETYIHSQKNLPPPDGFLSKPFLVDELLKVIAKLLSNKQVDHIQSNNHE